MEYCLVEPLGGRTHRVRLKFHFLPEVVEDVVWAKLRLTGLCDDVAHLTQRELAYLALTADGWSDEQIRRHWEVTPQATYYLRTSLMKRLGVSNIQAAVQLARGRLNEEKRTLPLGPSDWHTGRPPQNPGHLSPRVAEALMRYLETADEEQVALAMGVTRKTVQCQLWHARHNLGCATLQEAAERYLEIKEGRVGVGDQRLPLEEASLAGAAPLTPQE